MVTAMIGTGITFMPFAFRCVGYINAMLLIAFFGTVTFFSCLSIAHAAKHSGQDSPSYSSLAASISAPMAHIVNVSLFFNGYLTAINFYRYLSELLVENSPFVRSLAGSDEAARRIVVLVLAVPFFYLLMKKTLSALAFTSYLSIASASYLVFLMVYLYLTIGESGAEGRAQPFNTSFAEGIPFFVSSMTCQASMFKVYGEMRTRTTRDIVAVSLFTALGGMLIMGLTGLGGYLVFGEVLDGNVLVLLSSTSSPVSRAVRNGWDKNSIMCRMVVYCMMLVMFGGYPVQIAPVVDMLFKLLPDARKTETSRRMVVALLFVVCVLLALVKNLKTKVIKTICGAVFSNPIAFAYPFVYFLHAQKRLRAVTTAPCLAMIAMSIVICVWTVVRVINGSVK